MNWCHQCGWNLTASQTSAVPLTRLDRLYAAAGRRLGTRLAAAERLEPRLTPAKVLAYAIAVGVYALNGALVVAGLALLVLGFPNPFLVVLGLVSLGAAVLMRPRLGAPPSEDVVSRAGVPTLYALAADVSQSLGTAGVDVIQIVPEHNAGWAVLGLRRMRVLAVGLPLLTMLEPQERVALIAHELVHARNGDATRGLLLGSAVRGLAELSPATAANVPDRERERRRRLARLEETRLSDTHPPTAKRLELLESRPRLDPEVVLDPDRSAAVDGDLRRLRDGLQRRLVEDYRDALCA